MRRLTQNRMLSGIVSLYGMSLARVVAPLCVLPYLARVLSVTQYSVYTYARACLVFVNITMEYGFSYTATADVARHRESHGSVERILAETTGAKLALACLVSAAMTLVSCAVPMLEGQGLFVGLMVAASILTGLAPDFLFRGLEAAGEMAKGFLLSKCVQVPLVFALVRSERDFVLAGLLEAVSGLLYLAISAFAIRRKGYAWRIGARPAACAARLRAGLDAFIANIAATGYGALNTLVIGLYRTAAETAYWGTAYNIITAVLSLYTPIMGGIFPRMARTRDPALLKRTLCTCMPMVFAGVACMYAFSGPIALLLGGETYREAASVLRSLLPVLVFAFPGMLAGFPALGVIGREAKLRTATLVTAAVHVAMLAALVLRGRLTLPAVCLLRCASEGLYMLLKAGYAFRYRGEFGKGAHADDQQG